MAHKKTEGSASFSRSWQLYPLIRRHCGEETELALSKSHKNTQHRRTDITHPALQVFLFVTRRERTFVLNEPPFFNNQQYLENSQQI